MEKLMTEQELNDASKALINWFKSQNISPKDAALLFIKIIGAQLVDKTHDIDQLRDSVNLTAKCLALEIFSILYHDSHEEKR